MTAPYSLNPYHTLHALPHIDTQKTCSPDPEPANDVGVRGSVGDRIRRWREFAKLSKQALAERIGCTHSAISQWEHGHSPPLLKNLIAAARACGAGGETEIETLAAFASRGLPPADSSGSCPEGGATCKEQKAT
jgi:transcriptional regulator with XRE-family HTH domain